jgi:hypothetical protein
VGRGSRFSAKSSRYDLSKLLMSFIFGATLHGLRSDKTLNRSMAHCYPGLNWGSVPTGVRPEKGNSQ